MSQLAGLLGGQDASALLDGLFEQAPVGFQICAADGRSLVTNPEFRRLFGGAPAPDYNVLRDPRAERAGVLDLIQRAFAGEVVDLPMVWFGKRSAIQASAFPLFDAAGRVSHVALAFRDLTEQRRAEGSVRYLLELTTELSAALTVEQVARAIIHYAMNGLNASMGMVALLAPDGTRLELAHAQGYPVEVSERWRHLPLDAHGPITDAVRTRLPVVVNSLEQARASYPVMASLWEQLGNHSSVATPLLADDQVVGVLGLSFARAGAVDDQAQSLVAALARQCAQAVHRARLHEADRRARANQRFLADLSAALAHALEDEGATLDVVARLVVPEQADWCVVDLVDPEDPNRLLRVATAHPDPEHARLLRELRVARPLYVSDDLPIPTVVRTGEPYLRSTVSDEDLTGLREPTLLDMLRELRPHSRVSVPLVARGRTLGALSLSARTAGRYGEADVAFLRDVAGRCALAIDNARLFAAEQAAHEQLATVLRGVSDAVTAQDPTGRLLFANDAAARLLGYAAPHDLLSEPTGAARLKWDMLDEDGRPLTYTDLPGRRAILGEDAVETVLRYRPRSGGEDRWSLVRAHPVRDASGRVVASITVTQDITDRKRAERRLRFLAEAGARLPASLEVEESLVAVAEVAVETLADWCTVYLIDADGKRVTHRLVRHQDPVRAEQAREFERRYPLDQDPRSLLWQVAGSARSVLLPELPDSVLVRAARDPEHLAQLRAMGITSALWTPLVARGRTLGVIGLFTAESHGRLGPDDQALAEEIAARASLAIDNATLFAAERTARAHAEQAVRARDEFLGVASHELRNPVAAISGTAQLLRRAWQRGGLDQARGEVYVERIQRTAAHLANLTEDLLDVARLRQGRLPLRVRTVDLAGLITEVVERNRVRASEAGATIELHIEHAPLPLAIDADRIEQVAANLVDNALKYSPEGGAIHVSLERSDGGVQLSVRDQGIGLPPRAEEVIFEPFGRAPNAAARTIPGLGLGLYICRRLVEQHGGRLWATSAGEGRGTTLNLWLPTTSVDG